MPQDRRDLVVEETPKRQVQEDKPKLQELVDEAGIYLSLTTSLGWKKLMKDYLVPKTSMNRLLVAQRDELEDERAGVRELTSLLNFIDSKVKEGTRAYDKLKSDKEGG
jgi:hypothetical protein